MNDNAVWIALVSASGGAVLLKLLDWILSRSDYHASAGENMREELRRNNTLAWTRVDQLSASIDELHKRAKALEDDNRLLHSLLNNYANGVRVLVNQLQQAGIEPKWQPPER